LAKIFGQYDGTLCKQDVCRELCGVALNRRVRIVEQIFRLMKAKNRRNTLCIARFLTKSGGKYAGKTCAVIESSVTLVVEFALPP
jgi:hypothetical protein